MEGFSPHFFNLQHAEGNSYDCYIKNEVGEFPNYNQQYPVLQQHDLGELETQYYDGRAPLQFENMQSQQILSMDSPEIEDSLFPELRQTELRNSNPGESRTILSQDTSPPQAIGEPSLLDLAIYHKPRGSKGNWIPVAKNEALRVTKGKGKWLKVEVKSPFPIRSNNVELFLLDLVSNPRAELKHTEDEGFVVSTNTETNVKGITCVEFELKLDRVCKRLQFWARSTTPSGVFVGKSHEFGAHNNGKAKKETITIDDTSSPTEYDSNSSPIHRLSPGGIAVKHESSPPSAIPSHHMTSEFSLTPMFQPSTNIAEINPQKKRKLPISPEIKPEPKMEEEQSDVPSSVVPGSLRVHGVVRAKAFLQFSDLRLKADVKDISDALNLITQLQGKTFVWKNGTFDGEQGGKRVIGLIAQEVQRICPSVVHEDENGYLSVAYAELVPIVICAFKEHMREYETTKEEVKKQYEDLNRKMEAVQHTLSEYVSREETMSQPIQMQPMELELESTPMKKWKVHLLRLVVCLLLLVGVSCTVFGAILIGTFLAGESSTLTISVIQAIDLKPMDVDGAPDPYCQVKVGGLIFQTKVLYNDPNPLFEESFVADYSSSMDKVYFVIYDSNSVTLDLKMGNATATLDALRPDYRLEYWLELGPSSEGDTVSGSIQVAFYLSQQKELNYEAVVLAFGVVLTFLSLAIGFYTWRYPRA